MFIMTLKDRNIGRSSFLLSNSFLFLTPKLAKTTQLPPNWAKRQDPQSRQQSLSASSPFSTFGWLGGLGYGDSLVKC